MRGNPPFFVMTAAPDQRRAAEPIVAQISSRPRRLRISQAFDRLSGIPRPLLLRRLHIFEPEGLSGLVSIPTATPAPEPALVFAQWRCQAVTLQGPKRFEDGRFLPKRKRRALPAVDCARSPGDGTHRAGTARMGS